MFEINVTAPLIGMQTCAPLIKESGGGSIVNIGSVAGITGNFSTAYSASTWALEGLSRSAAYVYADWGIRCNVIQPGFIETDMTQAMSSNVVMKKMSEHTMSNTVLLRRSGKAEEIANTALFLASDEPSYITGTDIVVDGGWFSSAPTSATSARITCSLFCTRKTKCRRRRKRSRRSSTGTSDLSVMRRAERSDGCSRGPACRNEAPMSCQAITGSCCSSR
jgi:hypothetical protein